MQVARSAFQPDWAIRPVRDAWWNRFARPPMVVQFMSIGEERKRYDDTTGIDASG